MSRPSRLLRYVRYFGFGMIGSFVCCMLVGLALAAYTAIWIARSQQTTGQIVALEQETDPENGLMYAPVFRFTAADRKSYTITSSTRSNPPEFTVGEEFKVLYQASNPLAARVSGFSQLWLLPVVLGFIGIVHGFIGGVIFMLTRKYFRRTTNTPMMTS